MTRGRSAVAAMLLVALCAPASPAQAATESEKKAQALFLEAMKLLSAKQFAEACDKLAQSQELDPGMGTQFRLAECYEKLGRAASAYVLYGAVADAAKAAGKGDREALAKRRAAALEPKLAHLTISVPPSVAALPGLEVTRDGVTVPDKQFGTPLPVDPGDHVVTVRAPGKKPWEGKVWAEPAAKDLVSVGSLEDDTPPPKPPPPPRSIIPAIALGVGGGAGLLLGAIFTGLRAGKSSAAQTVHDQITAAGGNCVNGGMARYAADCQTLAGDTSKGDTFGSVAVAGFVIGGAALAGMGAYLLWPKPDAARTGLVVVPAFGVGEAGVTVRASF